jgi:hypothetical protein
MTFVVETYSAKYSNKYSALTVKLYNAPLQVLVDTV